MNRGIFIGIGLVVVVAAFFVFGGSNEAEPEPASTARAVDLRTDVLVPEGQEVATFATGCFWCMEALFQETDGITSAVSGYAGGTVENPTYEQVYTMATDHREGVQVFFDPDVITYEELLDVFWFGIDPTDDGGQFVDRGYAYTTAVFYHDEEQRVAAEASKQALAAQDRFLGRDIVTPITEFTTFYRAEEYHQDFYIKSPERYTQYEEGSGREQFREFIWAEIQSGSE